MTKMQEPSTPLKLLHRKFPRLKPWSKPGHQSASDSNGSHVAAENDPIAAGSSDTTSNPAMLNPESQNKDNVEGWEIARTRPYANAIRKNGMPSNPNRRNSNVQQNRQPPAAGEEGNPSTHRPQRKRRDVISGRRTANSEFASNEQVVDIFLGGCKTSTTNEIIETYCTTNNVPLKRCELLNSRNEWIKCFKLSVLLSDREKILDGDFWPCGVYVRKFFNNNRPRNSGVSNPV